MKNTIYKLYYLSPYMGRPSRKILLSLFIRPFSNYKMYYVTARLLQTLPWGYATIITTHIFSFHVNFCLPWNLNHVSWHSNNQRT